MISAQNTATKVPVKVIDGALPGNDATSVLYFDSVELVSGMDTVDLFQQYADSNILRANYERNPFSSSEVVHINRVGFGFNANVIQITGADQAATAQGVTRFLNNLALPTVEFGRTGGACFEREMRLKDLMAVTYSVEYISATVANIHLSTAPLIVLPQRIVLPPNEVFKLSIDFGATDGFPAAGTTKGLTEDKLRLEAYVAGYRFDPRNATSVGTQVAQGGTPIRLPQSAVQQATSE